MNDANTNLHTRLDCQGLRTLALPAAARAAAHTGGRLPGLRGHPFPAGQVGAGCESGALPGAGAAPADAEGPGLGKRPGQSCTSPPGHWLDGPDARITGQVARFITTKEDLYRSSLWRHLDGIAWQLSLNISYDPEAMAALWSAQVISPAGKGMEATALHYFGRPLRELDCHDLAALVVMVRAPRYFAPGSEASERFIHQTGLEAACGQPVTDSADAS